MPLYRIVKSPWPFLALIIKTRAAFSPHGKVSSLLLPSYHTTIRTTVGVQTITRHSKTTSCISGSSSSRSTSSRMTVLRMQEDDSSFQDELVGKQKRVSMNLNDSNMLDISTTTAVEKHLDHQQKVFDEMSHFFGSEEATPPEVEPVLDYLVKKALVQCMQEKEGERVRVMDVACGAGALFSSYIKAAEELGVELDIRGIDLSPQMTKFAMQNSKELVEKYNGKHSIECYQAGDFVRFVMGMNSCKESVIGFDYGRSNSAEDDVREKFDVCVMNACFGNFLDLDSAVTAASTCLKVGGVFVISHPLGSSFVEKLHVENSATVPHCLPTQNRLVEMFTHQPLVLMSYEEKANVVLVDKSSEVRTLYYASAKKMPYRMLRTIIRLRGTVDEGYGRGGKKLGFPTANLPSSLFVDALEDVPTGVYMGYAVIEPSTSTTTGDKTSKKGRGVIHKAVVNVGYSPTFDGSENKEKIVEAHLIVEKGAMEGDFYGETMRLALSGFLRPEMKFPSFPALIQAITNDVQTAKDSLDVHPYVKFAELDPFLHRSEEEWIGGSGGNEVASYEFESSLIFSARLGL
mmetsp:Transcript_14746/g.27725  ORF Transcript_14746/g.27725 Transcript_14746/m.27725 type:complete len:574 (-) Transcript_14746:3158-4879(-)